MNNSNSKEVSMNDKHDKLASMFADGLDIFPDEGDEVIEESIAETPFLDKYTYNLSAQAERRPNDYEVFGRENEIEDMVISLLRKTKNSPLLIGEAGVGKTAIVEGLALRIHRKQVPEPLQNLTVRVLELSSLMSNSLEGSFLAKFKTIIEELIQTKGENLLFIDEVHTLMGAGSNGQALDAGNVLKPALARGEIQLVGATTIDEYHETIENDRALQRRFQNIQIDEPTMSQAEVILTGVRPTFEQYHHVEITPAAIKTAISLSVRYIPDRFLPDKALDLLDEASTIVNADPDRTVVREQEIAEVLKRRTGIPVTTILKDEADRLNDIEIRLKKRVKGQDFAVREVADAVTISKAGLQDETKPIGTFLFLGTTGVGKTELAKALAEVLFDDENAMIRFDMSEYSQPGSSLKLIGTRKDKGALTEAVKHQPYSIVLFDELEKSDREVHDLLLQILDDGRLTDGTGRQISFKNTLVIMTTNIGAKKIKLNSELKGEVDQLSLREYNQFIESMEIELQTEFRPEFINRIDHKIVFKMLNQQVIKQIAVKDLDILAARMARQKISLVYDDELLDYLANNGTDMDNGARPLMRLINQKVLAPISRQILKLPQRGSAKYQIRVNVNGHAPNGIDELIDKRTLNFVVHLVRSEISDG